jgi:hypothetical protein
VALQPANGADGADGDDDKPADGGRSAQQNSINRLESSINKLEWQMPAGLAAHTWFVDAVTLGAGLVGAGVVVWAAVHNQANYHISKRE